MDDQLRGDFLELAGQSPLGQPISRRLKPGGQLTFQ
jgi:hypothetical protein